MAGTRLPFLIFILVLLMPAASPLLADTTFLARIGSHEIDAATLRELLPPLDPAQQRALAADPTAQTQLVRTAIIRRIIVELARRDQWDQNPAAQRQMALARDNALAESYLNAVCQVPESFPSDEELTASYQANQRSFIEPARYRLAQLFIAAPKDQPAATNHPKLEELLLALAQPEANFAELVTRFSDQKESASSGGEVGWLAESQLRPELRPLLKELQPGQVSRPVRLPDGWHLIKCLEIRPEAPLSLAQIRPALAERMRAERTAANRQAYMSRLLQDNPLSLNELALRDLIFPTTP